MNSSIYKFSLTTEMLEFFLCKRDGSLEDLLDSQAPFPSLQTLFQIEDYTLDSGATRKALEVLESGSDRHI